MNATILKDLKANNY